MQRAPSREWQKFGFGGPPQAWEHGAQRNLDRLATSYYLDILQSRQAIRSQVELTRHLLHVEELYTAATRHKHEIDYTLRHPATPAEQAHVEDRLGALMRIGLVLRDILEGPAADPAPEPLPAA